MELNEQVLEESIREILPEGELIDETITVRYMLDRLQQKLQVESASLKKWKPTIKSLLVKIVSEAHANAPSNEEDKVSHSSNEDESDVDLPLSRRKKQRSTISNDSDDSEMEVENDSVDSEDEVESDTEKKKTKKRKEREPVSAVKTKKPKISQGPKQQDPHGLAVLKEMGRAASIMGPSVYRALKEADSTEQAEEILRDRLATAGVEWRGNYPNSKEISAVKKQKMMEKDLEGIDPNLIISSSNRRARRTTTLKPETSKNDKDGIDKENDSGEERDSELELSDEDGDYNNPDESNSESEDSVASDLDEDDDSS